MFMFRLRSVSHSTAADVDPFIRAHCRPISRVVNQLAADDEALASADTHPKLRAIRVANNRHCPRRARLLACPDRNTYTAVQPRRSCSCHRPT